MHFVRDVKYLGDYKLQLKFEDGTLREVDLAHHLDGEVFEPLRKLERFQSVHLHADLDTIVWDNGADMSPDFLYDIGVPVAESVRLLNHSTEKSTTHCVLTDSFALPSIPRDCKAQKPFRAGAALSLPARRQRQRPKTHQSIIRC